MDREFKEPLTRRDFLKVTASLTAMGITTSLTPDLLFAKAKTDFKGVTIDYWAMIHQQNPTAKEITLAIIKAFEQRTGAKVKVTWEGYGSIIGPKYRTNFVAGKKPTVFDAFLRWSGAIRGYLRPVDDFVGKEWDAKTRDAIAWVFPIIKDQNRGYPDKDETKDLPFVTLVQAPLITRTDHWKKAGLDFDKNWPIRDSEHFLEVLKAFKTSKVTEYPTEVYGKLWDAGDTQLPGWIRSLDPEKADFINEDWTRSNADSDSWIKGLQYYVDLFRKYHYSSPNSPQSSDEESVEQLIRGLKSIIHGDILNRGTFVKRMPKEMEDGVIQWAPNFPMAGGKADATGFQSNATFHIVKQEGPDAEVKERAAWEFIKEWFKAENQIALAKSLGPCARRDVWETQMGAPDHYMESCVPMLENPQAWNNHVKGVDFQYNLFGPHAQKALGGADVATELRTYAGEVNKVLKG
jgi:hypothetical protein